MRGMEAKKKNILNATLGNRDVKLIENNEWKDLYPTRSKGDRLMMKFINIQNSILMDRPGPWKAIRGKTRIRLADAS